MGTFLCYTVVAALNLAYLARCCVGFSLRSVLIKPFLTSLPMAVASFFVYRWLAPWGALATMVAIAAGVAVFLLSVALFRAVSLEDALSLGLSAKLAKRLKQWHILSE